MRPGRWTYMIAIAALSPTLDASEVDGIDVAHYEPLQRLLIERPATAQQSAGQSKVQRLDGAQAATVSFDALGRTFELSLEPNTALLVGDARTAMSGLGIYRGQIVGNEDSWVRLVIADGVPRGLIWDGAELLAIEAPEDGMLGSSEAAIFRMADVNVAPEVMSCGTAPPSANGSVMYRKLVSELSVAAQQAPGAVEEISMGALGDSSFANFIGAGADAAIATRLNNVDGIFSQQLAIQISVDSIDVFSDANDPFTDELQADLLLTELANYRGGTPAQSQLGLTHLYTGRDLAGSTAGIAFVGALCSPNFGAGLSEGTRGPTIDSLISAHEIGHNFGADHDGDPDESCPNEPETFLMAPSVGRDNNTFGPCSLGIMQAEAAAASCITPLSSIDVTIAANGQPASVLLGNAANITFDVTNNGTVGATGVVADVSLPNNVTLTTASASQGTCTLGSDTVNCALGDVPGGSGRTVTVTASTDSVGSAPFSATVAADADDNANNNATVHQVTIQPAVNLTLGTPSSPSVALNQGTTLGASFTNTSALAATNVTVSVSLAAGLRADTATLSNGTCTVMPQQVDCTAAGLASQASASLSVGATGTVAGAQAYTVSVAATEADADPSNNSANGSVNVTSSSGGGTGNGGGEDDGGGSMGAVFLALLGSLLMGRRRRTLPI